MHISGREFGSNCVQITSLRQKGNYNRPHTVRSYRQLVESVSAASDHLIGSWMPPWITYEFCVPRQQCEVVISRRSCLPDNHLFYHVGTGCGVFEHFLRPTKDHKVECPDSVLLCKQAADPPTMPRICSVAWSPNGHRVSPSCSSTCWAGWPRRKARPREMTCWMAWRGWLRC